MEQLNKRTSRLSKVIGGALALMSTLFAVSADATHIPVTAFTAVNAGTLTATSSCVSGYFTNNWQTPGTGYWDYTVNTTGFTGITMTFKNQKSSAAGPTLGSIYYNIGGSDVLISSFVPSTSCPAGFTVVNLPVACENVATLHIKVKMTGATANTATHRITSDPFDGTTSSCTGAPTSGGSVAAGANPICAGTTTTLTLSGASAGGGITYQWQSSPNGSSWSNIAGATNLTYNTPANLAASTYYRVVVTCPASGLSTNSSSLLETVNSVSFGTITGLNSTLMIVDSLDTIATTPTGGLWQSSNTSRATIDAATGAIVAKKGGPVTFTYTVVDGTTGCVGTTDTTVNIVWPNTLALYVGENGNSTGVIAVPGETVGTVANTNFGTPASPCTAGGISGLTVPASVTAYNAATGPYVSYMITPNAGQALNIRRIVATTRESGTGPAKARIAYRINGGSWIDEGRDVAQNTGGSCGAASTKWDFVDVNGNNPTVNGITTNIEIAVFPYAPGASTGTFQLNQLEVYGLITSSTPCAGAPAAGSINETHVRLCDSGSYWLNFTGDAGVGITYQWEKSTTSATSGFSAISGATGASYNTGMLYATSHNYYRVVTTCAFGGATTSAADTVDVTATPSAGTITGMPSFLHSGETVTLTTSGATAGGTIFWRSNDTSAISIDSASGDMTGIIPGLAVITVVNNVNGCFGTAKDTAKNVEYNTVAAYIGMGGNSIAVDLSGDVLSGGIAKVGSFGTTSACTFGGLSGMTTTVTAYNTANPHVSMTIIANNDFTVDGFLATVRRSNSGPAYARLAYRVNNGTWMDDGQDQSVDVDDCGYSHNVLGYNATLPALHTNDILEVAVYPFNGAGDPTGGAFQVNTIDITAGDASAFLRPTSVANAVKAETIKLFPNPATDVLNVVAAEQVNVTILSIDGKKLIEQKNASTINISSLANGLYLIQIADANNNLIETAKFTKQ